MNARTEFQVIVGADGKRAFVVVPHDQLRRMRGDFTKGTVPNEIVNLAERVKRPRNAMLERAQPKWDWKSTTAVVVPCAETNHASVH